MKTLLGISAILLCASIAFGQDDSKKPVPQNPPKQSSKFPMFDGLKPRVEMHQALQKTEKFIKRQKINTQNYYLTKANLIQYGDIKNKQIVWYFRWVKVDGTVGDYIEIIVFMDGRVKRV